MSTQIDLSCVLGSGKYGTVFRGDYYGTTVAIKVVGMFCHSSRPMFSVEDNDAFTKECERMEKCKHENIVQYMTTTRVTMPDNGSTFPALVMTMMETDLRKYLEFQPCNLLSHKEIKIAHDIGKALSYLHATQEIVHGDLHTGNVLLKCRTAIEGPIVKICDFGLAKAINVVAEHFSTSTSYRAVEVDSALGIQIHAAIPIGVHRAANDGKTKPVSVMAQEIRNFGMVMWEIHTRHKPAVGSRGDDNLREINERPMHDVVRQCWDDTDRQPTATDLTETLANLQKQYPVINPLDELNATIQSQQDTMKDQQDTIKDQQKTIKDQQETINGQQKTITYLTGQLTPS